MSFRVSYIDSMGVPHTELPRIMFSIDGTTKYLVFREDDVIASVPSDAPNAQLWSRGKKAARRIAEQAQAPIN